MAGPQCPICQWLTSADALTDGRGAFTYDCPRCGPYVLTSSVQSTVLNTLRKDFRARAVVSHALRLMHANESEPVKLDTYLLDAILKNERLPTPAQQADSFVLWLGENQPTYSQRIAIPMPAIGAIIGTSDVGESQPTGGYAFIVEGVLANGFLDAGLGVGVAMSKCRLSFAGWQRYEELRTQSTVSRSAFMAMSFRNADVRTAYSSCFQPAVTATGFDLHAVNDPSQAGLIDLRIEVGIRRAKFVVADLTDANSGAYWEAGFAHGMGKPVIYTCEKRFFEANKTHFDTSHHYTVVWDLGDLPSAEGDLKTVIRATLPKDAKQGD
jgi:hypothetical protein